MTSNKTPSNPADDIVLSIKLPIPLKELGEISDAISRSHGKLFMRQVGPMLEIFKERAAKESESNTKIRDAGTETLE